jgi:uncharacterized membrane protein HdeD (DUF308 family)
MEQTLKDVDLLARNWWAILLKGLVALLFGVCTVLMPKLSLAALVFAYGLYALVDGLFALLASLQRRRDREAPRWAYFWMGLVAIGAGLAALFLPGITVLFLLYVIAAKAVIEGILQVVAAIRLRKEIRGEWLLVLSGLASLAFGVLLFAYPAASAVVLVLWIGVYALIYGATLLAVAFRLHAWERRSSLQHDAAPLSRPAPSSSGGQ